MFLAIAKARHQVLPPPDPALYVVANRQLSAFIRDTDATLRASMPKESLQEVMRLVASAAATGARPGPALVASAALAVAEVPTSALHAAYQRVLLDGADHGWGQVTKRRRPKLQVPVNPASVEWARERGSKLVQEISARQRELIRGVVARGLKQGLRADTMARSIRRSVGLLEREEAAVERRRSLLLEQGASEATADARADSYAEELRGKRALRIARTETVAAQNQGLLDGWKEARNEGELPDTVKRQWVSAPESPNPNRPCQICLELDGQLAGLDEPFVSSIIGQVMAPTAHPACRCAQVLRRG